MATMSSYDAGTLVRISAAFVNTAGAASDPGAVTCTVTKPDGVKVTPTAIRDSTGSYHADVDTTGVPEGYWRYVFVGTSPLQAVGDGQFYVKAVPV